MEAVDPIHLYQFIAILAVISGIVGVGYKVFGRPKKVPLKQPVTIRKHEQFATREELEKLREQHDRDIDQLRREFTKQLQQLNENGEGRYDRLGDRIDAAFAQLRTDFRADVGGLHEKINSTAIAVSAVQADVGNLQTATRDITKKLFFK